MVALRQIVTEHIKQITEQAVQKVMDDRAVLAVANPEGEISARDKLLAAFARMDDTRRDT